LKSEKPRVRVFNRQRKLPAATKELRGFLIRLASRLAVSQGFSVILISDRAMQALNRRFAGKNRATDVLSFPTSEDERSLDPYLGDIFISTEAASRQSSGELDTELKTLSLHGLLHLLGYDHETDRGRMSRFERQLRRDFGLDAR
jgi:probable rRNA maturation factor